MKKQREANMNLFVTLHLVRRRLKAIRAIKNCSNLIYHYTRGGEKRKTEREDSKGEEGRSSDSEKSERFSFSLGLLLSQCFACEWEKDSRWGRNCTSSPFWQGCLVLGSPNSMKKFQVIVNKWTLRSYDKILQSMWFVYMKSDHHYSKCV